MACDFLDVKFKYLVKNIDVFIAQFIFPFCMGWHAVEIKIEKIGLDLYKIKKIKQSAKTLVQEKFKKLYIKIWQQILFLLQTESCFRVHSKYVAILGLVQHLDDFIEKSEQYLCFQVKEHKELNAKFFARFFKLSTNPIRDQLQPNQAEISVFRQYEAMK